MCWRCAAQQCTCGEKNTTLGPCHPQHCVRRQPARTPCPHADAPCASIECQQGVHQALLPVTSMPHALSCNVHLCPALQGALHHVKLRSGRCAMR
eukprot:3985798-Alexandrium_andersonii.AAC.1